MSRPSRKEYQREYRKKNPEKTKAYQKTWREKNLQYTRDRQRPYWLKNVYGLTEEDYQKMLELQNGACAICGTTTPTGKWKVFAIDHCHISGKIRGLLCNECNRGIGLLRDSSQLLKKAKI